MQPPSMPAHDAEHDGHEIACSSVRVLSADERGRARIGQRQHGEDKEHAGGIAPVHAEDEPARRRRSPAHWAAATHRLVATRARHDGAPPHRRRGQAAQQAESARFDHARATAPAP